MTQYTHDSVSAVATQQVVGGIKDKLRAIFKARSKTTKDKTDKVDKTKLLKSSAEEIIKIGFPAVPTL